MRVPALMIEPPEETGRKPDGGIRGDPESGMGETGQERAIHVDLPCDADLAQGKPDTTSRIADASLDLLGAIKQDGPIAFPKSGWPLQEEAGFAGLVSNGHRSVQRRSMTGFSHPVPSAGDAA